MYICMYVCVSRSGSYVTFNAMLLKGRRVDLAVCLQSTGDAELPTQGFASDRFWGGSSIGF